MNNADLTRRKDAATPRGVGVMCNFYADRADNAELWDIEGRRYIDFAKATLPKGKTLKGLKVVVDGANGAAYKVAPNVLWELEAEVMATVADRQR